MEGLTPSQFADKLGVQRSGVSHLLSGRNKPSFEFINKMLVAYPKINPDWLITGNGKAYRDFPSASRIPAADNQTAALQPEDLPAEPNVPLEENAATSEEPDLFSMASRLQTTPVSDNSVPVKGDLPAGINTNAPTSAPLTPAQQQTEPQHVAQPAPQKYPAENRIKPLSASVSQAKRIAQITILYTDGTYEVR